MKLDKSIAYDYIRARCGQAATQGEIARELGVSRQRVGAIMRDLGLRARPRGRPPRAVNMQPRAVAPMGYKP